MPLIAHLAFLKFFLAPGSVPWCLLATMLFRWWPPRQRLFRVFLRRARVWQGRPAFRLRQTHPFLRAFQRLLLLRLCHSRRLRPSPRPRWCSTNGRQRLVVLGVLLLLQRGLRCPHSRWRSRLRRFNLREEDLLRLPIQIPIRGLRILRLRRPLAPFRRRLRLLCPVARRFISGKTFVSRFASGAII